jgi:hypothetical protein
MEKTEFSSIRRHLGKTQSAMAQLLGTSLKLQSILSTVQLHLDYATRNLCGEDLKIVTF